MAKRTWLWVVIAAFGLLAGSCVFLVGTTAWFVSQRVHTEQTGADGAEKTFTETLARFSGQAPYLTIDASERVDQSELKRRAALPSGRHPDTLHILAWKPGEEKLVRLEIPFWLLRLSPTGGIDINVNDFRMQKLRIDPADLDRAGPGLVLNVDEPRGRVVVWSE